MTRLYTHSPLQANTTVSLSDDQIHYLFHVLRFQVGQPLTLFNGEDGEWSASLTQLTKNKGMALVETQIRKPTSSPAVTLAFTPLKHEALLYLIEKATELGVSDLQPVITQRCNIHRLNLEKIERNTLEAAQQCERLSLPKVHPLLPLRQWLGHHAQNAPVIVCRERQAADSIATVLGNLPAANITFLIGPEGGFSSEEFDYLATLPFVHFCHLGPRILRAETAAVAALTSFQILKGDWQDT